MRAAAFLLCFFANPALAPEPAYVGAWAHTAAYCKGDARQTSDSPFRITRHIAEGHEWRCEIAQANPDHGGWIVRMHCAEEGEEFERVLRWEVTPDGMFRQTEEGQSHAFVRCKDSDYRGLDLDYRPSR